MITFVDTDVLLDVFLPDPKWGPQSKASLEKAFSQGSLIINEMVYSELAPQFSSKSQLDEALKILGLRLVALNLKVAYQAGQVWRVYRPADGHRNRILADFFIGAHAASEADQLLTRDRGFYKKYFPKLHLFK